MTSETAAKKDRKRRIRIHKKLISYRGILTWIFAIGLTVSYSGVVVPRNTYIRCNDPSISFDLQDDTISISTLVVVSLLIPYVVMTIFEWLKYRYQNRLESGPLRKGFRKASSYFLSLLVGSLFSFFIAEVLKTSVSEPRPHFMKSCSPNITEEQCKNPWIHVSHTNCSNPYKLSYSKILDTMKSFPSGHACIGVFSAVFMIAYFQCRVKVKWSKLLVVWFQLVCVIWALLCCVTRISDKKHHWWDVVVGGIIGGLSGYGTVVHFCNWFEEESDCNRNKSYQHEKMSSNDREETSLTQIESNGRPSRPTTAE